MEKCKIRKMLIIRVLQTMHGGLGPRRFSPHSTFYPQNFLSVPLVFLRIPPHSKQYFSTFHMRKNRSFSVFPLPAQRTVILFSVFHPGGSGTLFAMLGVRLSRSGS